MPAVSVALTLAALAGLVAGSIGPGGYETFPSAAQPHPTSAYKLHPEYKTWEQALPICRSEGAHLIVINSQQEADIANTLISRVPVASKKPKVLDQFHVGMHCKGRIGHWVTVLGGNLADAGWETWPPNQPSPDSPRPVHCGALLRSMRFNNLACNFHLCRFICEKPSPAPAPTFPPPPLPSPQPGSGGSAAPEVFETFPTPHSDPQSAYKLHHQRLPWEMASAICQREGAYLAVADSAAEAADLASLFARIAPTPGAASGGRAHDLMHVGITDKAHEGRWLTVHGAPIATSGFHAWLKGEPDNRGGLEHCAAITRDQLLVDIDCISFDDAFPFVCEKDLNTLEFDLDVRSIRRHS